MAEGVLSSDLKPVLKANEDLCEEKKTIKKVNGEVHCKYPQVTFSRVPGQIKDNSKDMGKEKIDNNDNVVKENGDIGLMERAGMFVPKQDLVDQIMELGICRNAAVAALFFTRNHSVELASNYILDDPARTADIGLKERVNVILAQQRKFKQEKRIRDDRIVDCAIQNYKRVHRQDRESSLHKQHHVGDVSTPHKHHVTQMGDASRNNHDQEEMEEAHIKNHGMEKEQTHDHNHLGRYESLQDTDTSEEDEMDEEEMMEIEDMGMEYKVVLVVNGGLRMNTGLLADQTAKATLGLAKVIMKIPFTSLLGPEEFSMWEDLDQRMETLRVDTDQHLVDLELMADHLNLPNYTAIMFEEEEMARRAVFAVFGSDDDLEQVTGRLSNMDSSD